MREHYGVQDGRESPATELAINIGLFAGLHKCPFVKPGEVPVLCGCPEKRCDALVSDPLGKGE